MLTPKLLQQIANLARASERRESARLIAEALGAEEMVIFLRSSERDEWVPVQGLESLDSEELRVFLRSDPAGLQESTLFSAADGRRRAVLGQNLDHEIAWALMGGTPRRDLAEEVSLLVPLWGAAFRAEAKVRALQGATAALEETRVLLRRALNEADAASRAKDEFLAALSNELRAPLNPVLMAAEAMQSDTGLPADIRNQAEIIRRNAQLEARLIDDLLDITRVRHGTLRLTAHPVNLHELLSQTEEVVKSDDSGKQVTIEFYKKATEYYVKGDAARLQQVFWNIIRNAAKFTPQGGRVQVFTTNPRPGRVVVQVTDTGMGIDPQQLPHIFDAFDKGHSAASAGFGGLGLGLTISRAIVELHGGQIRADSAGRGRGATFSVEFDAIAKPVTSAEWSAHGGHPGAQKLRLLLVEDHDPTREVLGRILGRAGHKVYAAANSQEALQIVGATAPFDVVISDLGLPDESGFTLMRTLKAKFGLPGIAISGFGLEEDVENARAAGFSAHLTKPVSFEDLRAALDSIAPSK